MPIETVKEMFINELRDMYDSENRILEGLEKMEQAASSEELKEAYRDHHKETQEQIDRLEKIFEGLEISPEGKECHGMKGIIAEGEETINNVKAPEIRDAALIAAAQKIEHYEIATYGTLKTLAKMLEMQKYADLLEETLEEEKKTDIRLTEIAISHVNQQAAAE